LPRRLFTRRKRSSPYASLEDRRGDASREETAHKVAWSAVKKKYEERGDTWTAKE
jgi:cation transport regulator